MSTISERALSYFRQPPHRLGCCQTIIAAVNGIDDPRVPECAAFSGGRSPDGFCGAAHAVRMLHPDLEDAITKEFTQKAGSVKCREIRAQNKASCQDCVKIAGDFLEAHK